MIKNENYLYNIFQSIVFHQQSIAVCREYLTADRVMVDVSMVVPHRFEQNIIKRSTSLITFEFISNFHQIMNRIY